VAAQVRRRGGTNTAGEWFQVYALMRIWAATVLPTGRNTGRKRLREAQAFPQADPLVGNRACMAMQRTGQADILFAVQFAGSISPSVREHERGPAADQEA
jgi:hypothetical protein